MGLGKLTDSKCVAHWFLLNNFRDIRVLISSYPKHFCDACRRGSNLQGIPPRGQFDNPLRHKIATINAGVAGRIRGWRNVTFFDVDPRWFITPGGDGSISHHDMYDYLHLTRAGYRKLFEPLLEEIQTLLKNFLSADALSDRETDN